MDTIGARIQAARKLKKWKQTDLRHHLGKAISTVRNWEGDKVQIGEGDIFLLSQVLGVSLEWLRDGEGEMRLPTGREVPKEIGGIPVIDALKGGQQLYRMPLMFGEIPLAYVTITIKIEPGPGAGGVAGGIGFAIPMIWSVSEQPIPVASSTTYALGASGFGNMVVGSMVVGRWALLIRGDHAVIPPGTPYTVYVTKDRNLRL